MDGPSNDQLMRKETNPEAMEAEPAPRPESPGFDLADLFNPDSTIVDGTSDDTQLMPQLTTPVQ